VRRRLPYHLGLALVFALTAHGCGSGDEPVTDAELERLARASGPRLYYAGRSFAGLPLTHAESGGGGRALFVYGTCEVEDPDGILGPEGGSCSPPVQIQVFPFDPQQWGLAAECFAQPTLRGVPTVRHDGLVLFTARTVVKIYARGSAEDRRVAEALRSLDGSVGQDVSLPPPSFDAETALVACR
jgi:hypothetical protein